jgi:DNA-binding FadR family transcriptional regulator
MSMVKSSFDIAAELRRRIADGEWRQGAKLPPERHLAQEFNAARNTLRKALDRLAEEGILQRQVGRGTFVTAASGPAPDAFLARMRQASPADVLETRIIIEPHAAALAATRASAHDLAAIKDALTNSLAAESVFDFEIADAGIHLAIIQAAKNQLLTDYCEAINEVRNQPLWQHLKKRSLTVENRTIYDRQHKTLVKALENRDGENAAIAMRDHLKTVWNSLLPYL